MTVMEDYLRHLSPGTWEIVKGGGVSDTTRGLHLLAEALEVASADPRLDPSFWPAGRRADAGPLLGSRAGR